MLWVLDIYVVEVVMKELDGRGAIGEILERVVTNQPAIEAFYPHWETVDVKMCVRKVKGLRGIVSE